ncbi:SH2 domain-containing protein 4A isoform X2 [Conger conger]|uniref:SH2 domain-containing protein 4A isoform X2 n=1 Tax=Conger conger TaxID=82655 RepID=UPI002A5A25B1|nr:SH2 domain-containing protein 4A isoform X2 [Conger conger]
MLQQILKDMYIDPDVLEALNEEQKKTLFLKMRQEQVRRWEEREEKQERDGGLGVRPKPRRAQCKNVSWLLGRDGDVHVCVIGEVDEFKASKLIYSGLGERKGSSVHKNTRCQVDVLKSSLVEHPTSDPVRDERENLPPATPTGIQLNLRENTEELKPAPHLPPLQQPKEVSEAAKPAASLKGPSHGSRPPISSKPCLPNHAPPSVTARLRPHDSPEQHNDKDSQIAVMELRFICCKTAPVNWPSSAWIQMQSTELAPSSGQARCEPQQNTTAVPLGLCLPLYSPCWSHTDSAG